MKKLLAMLFLIEVSLPGALRGEIADPVYRDGILNNINEHSALIYRYDNGNSQTYVVHSAGGGSHEANSVRVGTWTEFLGTGTFTGKRNKGISKGVREAILSDALDQLNAYYWGFGPFTYCWMTPNSSPASGDGCFRCDGLVEWCYEQNGLNLCNDAALFPGGPKYQREQLPAENDVAPTGVAMTFPSSKNQGNPTPTFSLGLNLKATSSDEHSGLSYNKPFEYFMSRWTNGAWTSWSSIGKDGPSHYYAASSNTYYAFYVRACDNDFEKADSSVYYLYAQPGIATPSGVTASDNVCDEVIVSWDSVVGAAYYWVFRDDNFAGETTYTWLNDVPGDTEVHIYDVVAYSSVGGFSAPSAGVEGIMGGTPNVPAGVMASEGAYCDQIMVYWSTVPGTLDYEIYRDGGYLGDDPVSPFVDVVTGSHMYTVKAKNGCGTSGASAEASGYTAVTPATPAGLTASEGAYCGNIQIAWNAVSNAMSYEVYRDGTQICEVAEPPFDDMVEGSHSYSVKAKNQCGTSEASASASGNAAAALSAPVGVSASGGTYSDRIQLSWNATVGAAGYEVWRNTNDASGSAQCVGSGIATSSWADVGVERGTSYSYWVNATNACGTGPMSDAEVGYAQGTGPTLEPISNQVVVVGQTATFPVRASDPENDSKTFSMAGAPTTSLLTGSGDERTFSYTAVQADAGKTFSIQFEVEDIDGTDTQTMQLQVKSPPAFVKIYTQRVLYGNLLTVPVTAFDPDGDAMTFSVSNAPPSAIFTPLSSGGILNYAPSEAEVGMVYTARFVAVDADGVAEMDVPIVVVGTEAELIVYHPIRHVVDGFGGRMESSSYRSETAGAQGQPVGWTGSGNWLNSAGFLVPESAVSTSTWEIVATATEGGTIAPSGTVMVANGSNQVFTLAPDEYYYVSDIEVDGTPVGATNGYEFAGVVSNRTIHAKFLPLLTSQGVPYGWLASYGLTNQAWDEAAATDQGYGRPAWEAWVAGTDPTNPATAFRVDAVGLSNGRVQVGVRTVPGRRYTFWTATNLSVPVWQRMEYSLTPAGSMTNETLEAISGQSVIYLPVDAGTLYYIRPTVQRPAD